MKITPEMIEAGARELWQIGNERIGVRPWETVSAHYLQEAEACLKAAQLIVDAKKCVGYPDCDGGDLEGEEHSAECPAPKKYGMKE